MQARWPAPWRSFPVHSLVKGVQGSCCSRRRRAHRRPRFVLIEVQPLPEMIILFANIDGRCEVATGREPLPFIEAMDKCAKGGMLAEQVWDADDLPNEKMNARQPDRLGHAAVSLVRSHKNGVFPTVSSRFYQRVAVLPEVTLPKERLLCRSSKRRPGHF